MSDREANKVKVQAANESERKPLNLYKYYEEVNEKIERLAPL